MIPFHSVPPLSGFPITLDSYSPQSVKGRALEGEIQALRYKGAVKAASPPGFYFSRVFQLHVCGHRGIWKVETHHRFLHFEPVGDEDAVSHGDCPVGSLLCVEERLDGLHRSEGRIPSDPYSPIESQVSQVHSRRKGLEVQGPLLWSVHGASGVPTGHGSCVWFPSSVRGSDAVVSGRLVDFSFVSQGSLLGKGQGPESLSGSQHCCEFGQVFAQSVSASGLSGDQDRVTDFLGFANSLEDRKVLLHSRRISVLKVQSARFWRVLLVHLALLTHLFPGGRLRVRALHLALK